MKQAVILVGIVLALSAPAMAEITTWSTEFTIDGSTYRKDTIQDDASWSTSETLYLFDATGSWSFVASLYSDGETGNWTGKIEGVGEYADQWNDDYISPCSGSEYPGDWEVVIGAEIWPCWEDFSEALTALHFWDDGGVIFLDPLFGDGIAVFALEAGTGELAEVETDPAMPWEAGLMNAFARGHRSPQARLALMDVLTNPTPHDSFPANPQIGRRSPRAGQHP